jgi:hypothetical protein
MVDSVQEFHVMPTNVQMTRDFGLSVFLEAVKANV